jgi:hypothetical protein
MSMSGFLRDLRLGARLLTAGPVFTATAVLMLAIGISANALIFSAVNALLLRPLPVSHPENLVRLVEVHPNDFVTWELPYSFCPEVGARDASLSEVICQGEADLPLSDGNSTERARVHFVSPNFFSSLGVSALLGRVLTAEDEQRAAPSAVLSYDFWRRRFQGDTTVVGRSVSLDGHAFTIVGVRVVTFSIDPSLRGYVKERSRALSKALLDRTCALPGVAAASLAGRGLMRGTGVKQTVQVTGRPVTASDFLNCSRNEVTPDYFRTSIGQKLHAKRQSILMSSVNNKL